MMLKKSYGKALACCLYIIIAVFLPMEFASRIYLQMTMNAPFFMPTEIIYYYYPHLKIVKDSRINKEDGYFDILFLGGSTLNKYCGNIEELLQKEIQNMANMKVRIYNLAVPAHTSLDSYYKYKHLTDKQFDLILFYHGINEVRANNCPPALFKDNYSHYSWYEDINTFERHKEISFITLPYVFHRLVIAAKRKYAHPEYIPAHRPNIEWVQYGSEIKTGRCFRDNLANIVEIALKKREPVLLMTYAFFVPEGYSFQKFKDKSLNYGKHRYPIETWGEPDNVVKGIDVHNKVIRNISNRYKDIIFVDQNSLIPKDGLYFDDICHFSEKGCEKFVDNIVEVIITNAQRR